MSNNQAACNQSELPFGFEADAGVFPFLESQGHLRDQWYPISFSHDVIPNRPKRQQALGVPVLIWRLKSGELRGFLDVCPHRQAPLSGGTIDGHGITCPYHGWRFGTDGRCNQIPIAPTDKMPRQAVSLTRIMLYEHGGMIWSWFGAIPPNDFPNVLSPYQHCNGWQFTTSQRTLASDLDDTVENFMDFAHTPVVHPGLIRGISSAKERGVTIEVGEQSVRAVHDPIDEKVGLFSGFVVPRGKPVQHSDTFSLPGNVHVEYWFGGDPPKFFAFLGMTPVAKDKTLVLLTIGFRFERFNPLLKLALPLLIHRVLKQDQRILAMQRENLDLLAIRGAKSLKTDAIDSVVRALRKHMQDESQPRPQVGTRRIHVVL